MKRLLLLLLLSAFTVSLYAFSFGYSIAPVGERSPFGDSYGAVSLSCIASPSKDSHIGDIEAEAKISFRSPVFQSLGLRVSAPLFLTAKNPFSFLFANATLYSVKASLGAQYNTDGGFSLYMSISPFNFQDTSYVYEFLSPYALYDIKDGEWGYGAYIMRFIYFF